MQIHEAVELVCAVLRAVAIRGQFDAVVLDARTDVRALGVDSVQVLEMIGLIEDVCGCHFPDAALPSSATRTVADIAAMVVQHVPQTVVVPPGGWAADARLAPPVPTSADLAAEARVFEQLQNVLSGHVRWPVSGPVAKMSKFMLRPEVGCDATISDHTFRVHYGGHDGPCLYAPALAVGVLSHVLTLGAVAGPVSETRLRLPAAEQRDPDDGHLWSHGARDVWIHNDGHQVRLAIRKAGTHANDGSWPPPLDPR